MSNHPCFFPAMSTHIHTGREGKKEEILTEQLRLRAPASAALAPESAKARPTPPSHFPIASPARGLTPGLRLSRDGYACGTGSSLVHKIQDIHLEFRSQSSPFFALIRRDNTPSSSRSLAFTHSYWPPLPLLLPRPLEPLSTPYGYFTSETLVLDSVRDHTRPYLRQQPHFPSPALLQLDMDMDLDLALDPNL
ncbi:hypothetical protein Landi51_07087 [Colletotrichum acutatum]